MQLGQMNVGICSITEAVLGGIVPRAETWNGQGRGCSEAIIKLLSKEKHIGQTLVILLLPDTGRAAKALAMQASSKFSLGFELSVGVSSNGIGINLNKKKTLKIFFPTTIVMNTKCPLKNRKKIKI